ncbi:class III extradiol ring-cleavage dioxygenase [Pseudobacillus sp. FSL P4-0506]|uniref:dioxygenase family protein n=1 Tax=unclassified Pseudobacillus TaxID=2619284 RepID=UPI0030F50847
MMPSFFIAHGAPLLAIEDNEYTQFLTELGRTLVRPKAIVLLSAHWESPVQKVSDVNVYSTIYDFGGFPEALYQIQYPARGDKHVAKEIQGLFTKHRIPYEIEKRRGLDHGAWVILRMLYPEADIPVVAMSVNSRLTPEEQYKIGKALVELRENDILIIGSGGTVHNLGAVNMAADYGAVDDWAVDFDEWVARHLQSWELDTLFHYDTLAPTARLAVPPYGKEHFIPIFYAMGAADDKRTAELLHRSYRYGNLSHSVWQFG